MSLQLTTPSYVRTSPKRIGTVNRIDIPSIGSAYPVYRIGIPETNVGTSLCDVSIPTPTTPMVASRHVKRHTIYTLTHRSTKLQYFPNSLRRIMFKDLLEVVEDVVVGGRCIAHYKILRLHPGNLGDC